jgi:hypothetical protein
MELLLRDAIKQAITEGDLNAKDWLKEPVPQLFVILIAIYSAVF